jgi:hypothetical protein
LTPQNRSDIITAIMAIQITYTHHHHYNTPQIGCPAVAMVHV